MGCFLRGETFRPDYRRVGSLRALMPHCPVLAVTATANATVYSSILETLHLPQDVMCVTLVPDRYTRSMYLFFTQKGPVGCLYPYIYDII